MKTSEKFVDPKTTEVRDALAESVEYAFCLRTLEGKQRRTSFRVESLEDWIHNAVYKGLAELEPFEKMTRKQREESAKKIASHCEALRELLIPFWNERSGLDWPFQPYLDRAALESALNYQSRLDASFVDEDEREDDLIRKRFAIYHAIRIDLGLVFDAIHCGAELLPELTTEIKRPNDPNVRRLRFIRRLTSDLQRDFGTPHRAVVLALASIFFDTSDLDEAAISKLAPVQ
jgi:hypothetical protein